MRTIAMAAFLGSTAVTGTSLALLWAFALQQTLALVIVGTPIAVLSAGIALGTPAAENLDARMSQNQTHQRLSRPQPRRRPLGPVTLPSRNGHSRAAFRRSYTRSLDPRRGLR